MENDPLAGLIITLTELRSLTIDLSDQMKALQETLFLLDERIRPTFEKQLLSARTQHADIQRILRSSLETIQKASDKKPN